MRLCGNIRIPDCYFSFVRHQSQWPSGLSRTSSAARLLGRLVRIPPGSRISVCCEYCVLWGRGVCLGLITRPDESYWVWGVWVWWSSLDNEDAPAHKGLSSKEKIYCKYFILTVSKGRAEAWFRGVLPHVALNGAQMQQIKCKISSLKRPDINNVQFWMWENWVNTLPTTPPPSCKSNFLFHINASLSPSKINANILKCA